MPSSATGTRIDWMPGDSALDALEVGEQLFPGLRRQEVIDRLVMTGVSALLHKPWAPPTFPAGSRYRWRLPSDIAAKKDGGDSR